MAFDFLDLDTLRSIEERTNYQKDVQSAILTLNEERAGLPFNDEQRAEDKRLKETDAEIDARNIEDRERLAYVAKIASNKNSVESTFTVPNVSRATKRDEDIYDVRSIGAYAADPETAMGELRERAHRVVELTRFSHTDDKAESRDRVANLIDSVHAESAFQRADFHRRIIVTASPTYERAFPKAITAQLKGTFPDLTREESRALSLAGSGGGFAVPYDLDPSIIPTSNSVVNPIREISRIVQTTVDTWRGVSSGAITASFAAEATETTDNAPTLVQPEISTEKAQAFIPFSIEVDMDWPGMRGDMSRLLAEAKDDLEAVKFSSGGGTNEPFGLLTGTTNTVAAAAGQTFTLANLYSLMAALPPRYRSRASWLGSLAVINRIRQFDTAGGAALWETLANDAPARLLGKPFYELSSMADVATSVKFLVYGDFSRFVIVDRIGLNVEVLPLLLGANRRPTGERGLYAFWRVGSKVVDANGFRALIGTA
jgi:HK97 family phage major capsid protein